MLIFPGPGTSESQQIPEPPQLIENTIAFLGETAQSNLASYKPIPRPTAGAAPKLPIFTLPPNAICNSTGIPSADVCAKRIQVVVAEVQMRRLAKTSPL